MYVQVVQVLLCVDPVDTVPKFDFLGAFFKGAMCIHEQLSNC